MSLKLLTSSSPVLSTRNLSGSVAAAPAGALTLTSIFHSEESSKKSARPEIVKLNRGFKLAENWVSNMTRTTDNESTRVVLEARPPGLGIGAVVPRQTKVVLSNDPVERKLRAQIDAGKRKLSRTAQESEVRDDGSSDEDEESESRTKAFVKRKASKKPK